MTAGINHGMRWKSSTIKNSYLKLTLRSSLFCRRMLCRGNRAARGTGRAHRAGLQGARAAIGFQCAAELPHARPNASVFPIPGVSRYARVTLYGRYRRPVRRPAIGACVAPVNSLTTPASGRLPSDHSQLKHRGEPIADSRVDSDLDPILVLQNLRWLLDMLILDYPSTPATPHHGVPTLGVARRIADPHPSRH